MTERERVFEILKKTEGREYSRQYDVWKHEAKDFKYCPNCGARMDKE